MFIRRPDVLRHRPLKTQPLVDFHIMHVLAHRSPRVLLNNQLHIPLLILIVRRRIRTYNRLLHPRTHILRNQRRRHHQPGNIIRIGKREPEFLRVMVDRLDGLELQVEKTLFATGEGVVWRRGCFGGDGVLFMRGGGRDCAGWRRRRHRRHGPVVVVISSTS